MALTLSEVVPPAEGSKRLAPETGPIADKKSKRRKQSSDLLQSTTAETSTQGTKEVKCRRGEPPVWANTRQQIVDTLDWFPSMQGGAAHTDKQCTGFLLDSDNGARSFMNDEVIITRTGGDSKKDGGKLSLKKDQSPDGVIITSIMASFKAKKPVGVVIGSNNELLKIEIPHRYCVMDWFIITDVWMEKMGKYAGYRVRLEKLDLSTKGWWTEPESDVQGSDVPSLRSSNRAPPKRKCKTCGKFSTQIYIKPGWTCLQLSCPKFWKIGGTELAEEMKFEYHPDFLSHRQPRTSNIPSPGPLAEINDRNIEQSEGSADREEWRGIVCPKCRKCIQRVTWDAWDCANDAARGPRETCCYKVARKLREVPLQSILEGVKPFSRNQLECGIEPTVDKTSLMPFEVRTYEIPGVGSVTHFVSNATINERADGPDYLFSQLQNLDLGLRRYPLGAAQVKGTLTCHFAVNYGVPYKYVVSVDSKAFNDAPSEILTALGRLSWATEQAVTRVGGQYQPPNELLALGYFKEMKIGFHDDGENDLGPTIATLSLGARSRMYVRMKYKYYFGLSSGSGVPTPDDPVLPGCRKEDERQSLKEQFETGQITKDEYKNQRKTLLSREKKGDPPKLLTLELKHGDLIVMHGAELQKYYEHAVEPDHGLRFALTARYIQTKDEEDLLKGAFKLHNNQIYDGQ